MSKKLNTYRLSKQVIAICTVYDWKNQILMVNKLRIMTYLQARRKIVLSRGIEDLYL